MFIKKRFCYTLIELIVTMSLIIIIASLLIVVLDKSKQKVSMTACTDNQKRVGICFSYFQGDNSLAYPIPRVNAQADANTLEISFDDSLSNYDGRKLPENIIRNANIAISLGFNNSMYQCPGDVIRESGWWDTFDYRSYKLNEFLVKADINSRYDYANSVRMIRTPEVARPAELLVITEDPGVDEANQMGSCTNMSLKGDGFYKRYMGIGKYQKAFDSGQTPSNLHDGKIIALMADGHVREFVDAEATLIKEDGTIASYTGNWNYVDDPVVWEKRKQSGTVWDPKK